MPIMQMDLKDLNEIILFLEVDARALADTPGFEKLVGDVAEWRDKLADVVTLARTLRVAWQGPATCQHPACPLGT